MTELMFGIGLIGGFILFVVILIAGTFAGPRMGIPGWTMAVGTVFLLLGIAGLSGVIIIDQWRVLDFIDENDLWDFTFTCLTPASILFTTGFVWNRIRHRKDAASK
jgi:hypothetical protein